MPVGNISVTKHYFRFPHLGVDHYRLLMRGGGGRGGGACWYPFLSASAAILLWISVSLSKASARRISGICTVPHGPYPYANELIDWAPLLTNVSSMEKRFSKHTFLIALCTEVGFPILSRSTYSTLVHTWYAFVFKQRKNWIHSLICTVWLTVRSNPSGKRSFPQTMLKR